MDSLHFFGALLRSEEDYSVAGLGFCQSIGEGADRDRLAQALGTLEIAIHLDFGFAQEGEAVFYFVAD